MVLGAQASRSLPECLPPTSGGRRPSRPGDVPRPYAAMQPDFRAELIGGVVFIPPPLRSEHGESYALVMGWVTYYWDVTPGVPVSRRNPPLTKGRLNTVTAGAKRRAVRAVIAGTSASLGSSKSPSKVPL